MEKVESEPLPTAEEEGTINYWPWLHVSAQLIHYIVFQYVSFPNFVTAIQERVHM